MDITSFIKGAVDASARDPHASVPLAALTSLLGPLDLYPASKDIQNQHDAGMDELQNIDKGHLFSKNRMKHYAERSMMDRSHIEKLKAMLLGGGLGAAAGAGLGAYNGTSALSPALMGGVAGILAGLPVGGARGAQRYNSEVVDNPQIFKKPLA